MFEAMLIGFRRYAFLGTSFRVAFRNLAIRHLPPTPVHTTADGVARFVGPFDATAARFLG